MSQDTTEPSQASPETPSAEPKAPVNAAEARAKLKESIAKELAAKRGKRQESDDDADETPKAKVEPKGEKPKDEPATAVEKRIDKAEAKLEDAGVDVPNQKKGESDSKYELRLAELLRENEQTKRELEKTSTEAKKLAKLIESGKANPLTILDHLGLDFEKLVQGLNPKDPNYNPKWSKVGQKPQIPDELLQRIDALEKDKKDAESKAKAAELEKAATERLDKDTKKITSFLDANSEEFPFLASVPWGAAEVVRQCNAKGTTDAGPIIRALEENLANNMEKLVTSDKAMKKAIKANPALKAALKAYLDDEPVAKIKKGDEDVEIKGVGDLVAEPPARSSKKTPEEERKSIALELKERRKKQRERDSAED